MRVWREHRGLGVNALARAANISAPYLSEIENGSKPGSAAVLKKIASALEIDLDELVRHYFGPHKNRNRASP